MIDMHVHSRFSFDGVMEPRILISLGKKRGLSGGAIVDHGTVEGALRALDTATPGTMVVVGGEIPAERGELIGLLLSEGIKSRDFLGVVDEIKGQNGMVVLAHPCRFSMQLSRTFKGRSRTRSSQVT
jgi:hypothetical protein